MEALLVKDGKPPQVEFVRDHTRPEPATGEVLIQVRLAGVCATDLEITRGYMRFAGVPGHEFVGAVIAGSQRLHGKRVVGEINCTCGECNMCRRGMENHCRSRTVLGIAGRDGAFAQYLTLPEKNCHIVPEEMDDEQAVFAEPLAAAVQIVRHCPIDNRMRVTVIGTGRLGLLAGQVLARYRCKLTMVGRNPRTLALAEKLGLDARDIGDVARQGDQDVVVECTGSPAGLRLAQELVRPRGTIVLKSTYADAEPIDLSTIVVNEVRVLGNRCGPFADALELLRYDKVKVAPLITATYPLHNGAEALAAAGDPGTLKVLIRPSLD